MLVTAIGSVEGWWDGNKVVVWDAGEDSPTASGVFIRSQDIRRVLNLQQ